MINALQDERSYRRFIILSLPRSGTHMLRTALDAHPQVVCHTEMFNPGWIEDQPYDGSTSSCEILNHHVFRQYPPEIGAVGFTIHRCDARVEENWPSVWEHLDQMPDLYVLSLRRENLLRRYLSFYHLDMKLKSGNPRDYVPEPLTLSPRHLREDFFRTARILDEFEARFGRNPTLHLTYEHLVGRFEEAMRQVQEFLGVPYHLVKPTTTKSAVRPLSEDIVNYSHLREFFDGTPWATYFKRSSGP